MRNMRADEVRKGESCIRLSRKGMRRSCDACGRKKKRCDGEHPCRRCVRSESECRYSKRRWYGPDPPQRQHHRQPLQSDHDAVDDRAVLVRSTPGGPLLEHRLMPLKRCTLRASPATGLVGMQENAFLSDFFGCVGLMPLTNESEIREAMVKIMVPAAPRQALAFGAECCGEGGPSGTLLAGGALDNVSGMDQLPKDPAFCTFWCAVAMGALAKGCPFETVACYAQLAREALAASGSSSTYAELAKASAILTYLYSFLGDAVLFREYLDISECFVHASIKQGSTDTHAGLPDLILHYRKVANVQSGPMDSSWVRDEGPPQLNTAAAGVDIYRFVAQSLRAFDQAVFAKAQERCGGGLDGFYSGGPSHQSSPPDDPLPGDVSEAIAAVLETTDSLEFEPLQETADRPGIRAGVVGLLINGTLVFEKAVKGDLDATLEKLDRAVEVYERYPGLCRCMMSSHMSHILLTTLAAIGDGRARRMYKRLRRSFNSCRASHTLPVPPLDEWRGMASICSDLTCRSVENLIKSEHMKAFTALPVKSIHDNAGLQQTTCSLHGETQSEVLRSTGVASGEIADLVQAARGSRWNGFNATSKCAGLQNSSEALCHVGAALEPQASPSYPGSLSDTGADNACIVNDTVTRALDLSPRSAWVGGHHEDNAEPEDAEIAAADWLEVTHAMLDAFHTSEVIQ